MGRKSRFSEEVRERATQYATDIDNIRDVIPFPRAARQADF